MIRMTGYWIFGTNLGGNVLKQFSGANPDDVISLVTIGFLFTIVFVFPMVNFSLRICIHHLLHGETDTTRLQHVMETIVPFVVALAAALFVTDLGVVYGLIGSIGACSFALLFPALLYLRSVTMKDKSARMVWSCRVLFAVGVLMMVMGVLSSLGVKM
jgi:mannose/fructose/N-acetylgalactosamine-specific phosphotransferase system component IID